MRAVLACRIALLVALDVILTATTAWSQEASRLSSAGSSGKKYALLVACRYLDNQKELNPLRCAHNDILAFADTLRKRGFAKDNITLMYDEKEVERRYWPECKKIQHQVSLLLERLRPSDTVIVALSGHGVQFKGEKRNYFCPVDAELAERDTLLALDWLYEQLEKCKAVRKLLVVDACRNDPFSDVSKSARLKVDWEPETVPEGIVALFSCGPGQRSYEYPPANNIKHSVFFHHFLEAWNGAAVDEDGKLTLGKVVEHTFEQTSATVARLLNDKQHPQQKNESGGIWVLWEQTVGELRRFQARIGSRIRSVAFSPKGELALSGGEDRMVRLWEVETGKELRGLEGHTGWVRSVAFAPDGRQALSGSDDLTVRLWDLDKGQVLKVFRGHDDMVCTVAFTPDSRHVLSAGADRTIRLWDRNMGQEVQRFRGHTDTIWSVVFSSDGSRVLSGSADKTVRLWDVQTGQELQCFRGHEASVYSVAFAPDDLRLLSGSDDKTVRLWDVRTGKQLTRFTGHTQPVISVAFSPDGRQALSGGADHTLRLWDLTKGVQRRSFQGHEGNVLSVVFSPDGHQALTGSLDRTIRLWGLPRKEASRE